MRSRFCACDVTLCYFVPILELRFLHHLFLCDVLHFGHRNPTNAADSSLLLRKSKFRHPDLKRSPMNYIMGEGSSSLSFTIYSSKTQFDIFFSRVLIHGNIFPELCIPTEFEIRMQELHKRTCLKYKLLSS
jgi:hypothetical protein